MGLVSFAPLFQRSLLESALIPDMMWRILAALYSFSLLFGGGDMVCANLAELTSSEIHFPRLLYAGPLFVAGACFVILTVGVARKAERPFWHFVRRNRLAERTLAVIIIAAALEVGFDHYCKSKLTNGNQAQRRFSAVGAALSAPAPAHHG